MRDNLEEFIIWIIQPLVCNIPQESFFPSLKVLDLSENDLNDPSSSIICNLFSALPRIQSIDLTESNAEGQIKFDFANLSKGITKFIMPKGGSMLHSVKETEKSKYESLIKSKVTNLAISVNSDNF